jgi:membrane-associated phospholipid phosphatase
MGQVEVFGTVGLGTLVTGVLAGNGKLARAGGRISAALLLAGAVSGGGKLALGRERPDQGPSAFRFHPFSRLDTSLPSGHTTMAFALAASIADEVRRPWATVLLYSAATGTGWSRINDNRHWLSDVVAGALVGVTSAKLVNGHWRIGRLRPPSIIREPGRLGFAWPLTLPH